MPNVSFSGLLIVAVVAFAAPLLLGLTPARRLPAIVLEIVAGIIIARPSLVGSGSIYRFQSSRCLDSPSSSFSPGWKSNLSG